MLTAACRTTLRQAVCFSQPNKKQQFAFNPTEQFST
jgi:hypothetical protein